MEKHSQFFYKLHGIRGTAILLVLLFHFFDHIFPGGYLGVDLFFLLSGFLVTKSVFEGLENPKNNLLEARSFLKDFYAKRVARILPMVIVSSIISLLVLMLFVPAKELRESIGYAISAVAGLSNIKLFHSAQDYFSKDLEFNFFTQTWSLGIEEQFYFFFSFVIVVMLMKSAKSNRHLFSWIIGFGAILSLFMNLFTSISPEARFYLLPFRWWELSIGTLAFIHKDYLRNLIKKFVNKHSENLLYCLFFVMLFVPYNSILFPLPILVPVIFGGVFFLVTTGDRTNSFTEKLLCASIFQYLGTISYSLYLIHWVVLVFIKHSFGLTIITAMSGFAASILFAGITYKFIELPFLNYLKHRKDYSIRTILCTIVILVSCFYLNKNYKIKSNPLYLGNFLDLKIDKWGGRLDCSGLEDMKKLKDPLSFCLGRKNQKTVYLTGDSHAMQLYYTVKLSLEPEGYDLRHIDTYSEEGVSGFTRLSLPISNKPEVFEYIVNHSRQGDIVILSFASYRMNRLNDERLSLGRKIWLKYLRELSHKGVKVIIVKDSPVFKKEPVELCPLQVEFFNNYSRCEMPTIEAKALRKNQDDFYQEFLNIPNVYAFDLLPYFCDELSCKKFRDGELIFFDHHHYTKEISIDLAKDFSTFLETIK